MKPPSPAMLLLLLFMASLAVVAAAAGSPSPAPSPLDFAPSASPEAGSDCSGAFLNLSSCLSYVENGSSEAVPDKGCCPALSQLVDNNPVCLCELLSSGDVYGIPIDTARALTLPAACRVSTPPVSFCAVLGIPVPSPLPPTSSPSPVAGEPGSSTSERGGSGGVLHRRSVVGLVVVLSILSGLTVV